MIRTRKTKPAAWLAAFPEQRLTREKPKRQHIRSISSRKAGELRRYRAESRAWAKEHRKAGTKCPVMLALFNKRLRVSDSPHHIRGRLGTLLRDKRYWLAVSMEGHDWIHTHPHKAQALGWLAGPGEWNVEVPA